MTSHRVYILVALVLVALENQASAESGRNVECSLAVLGILLGALGCEVLLHGSLHTYGKRLHAIGNTFEI